MLRRTYRWFNNVPFANPTERHMAILVQLLLAGFSLIALLGALLWAIVAQDVGDSMRPAGIGLAVALVMGYALRILRNGRLDYAVLVATTGLMLALWFNYNGVGVRNGGGLLITFVLPITLAGFMSGRRGLVLTIILTALLVGLTVLLESRWPELAGYAAPKGLPDSAALMAFALVIGLLGFFIDQGVSTLRQALEAALAREQELERAHRVLEVRTYELMRAKEELERELGERARTEAALAYERDLLQSLMDSLPDTIYFKDTTSRFLRVNRAQALMFGITDPGAAVGKTDFDFQPPELAKTFFEEEQRIMVSGEPLLDRLEFNPMPDGRPRWLSATKAPLRDREGRIIGIVGLSRDITARHEVERMKNEFVATVSHELRTPLTSIRGSLGLLAGGVVGPVPATAQAMLDIALKNSERLTRLVDDILDIAKIESGRMVFNMAPLDLTRLVGQAIEANRSYAEQHGVTFLLARTEQQALVRADVDRLTQVIANLLSNAAKFSPRDATVEIAIDRLDRRLRVAVADHGPGITEEFSGRIFGKFAQADASDTRQKGGTGLGLSIAKALIERMGGRIWFSSTIDVGSTFYIDLPEWTDSPDT
jgi:PAS domain S-box-containing protein